MFVLLDASFFLLSAQSFYRLILHFYSGNTVSSLMEVLALLYADKKILSHRWASFLVVLSSISLQMWKVLYIMSWQLVILWCWLNWKLPFCGRILFPDIRNTVTFTLPTFTWLILTAVHGAAWSHLQALSSRVKPCTYIIRNERGTMYASLFDSCTQGGGRKVNRQVALMIILEIRLFFFL